MRSFHQIKFKKPSHGSGSEEIAAWITPDTPNSHDRRCEAPDPSSDDRMATLFHPGPLHETIPTGTKPFSACGAERMKPDGVITGNNDDGRPVSDGPTGGQMRILSFILASALILAGSTMAGSADAGLPGVGTFHYSDMLTTTSASLSAVVQ
jgi:hypothetical protein